MGSVEPRARLAHQVTTGVVVSMIPTFDLEQQTGDSLEQQHMNCSAQRYSKIQIRKYISDRVRRTFLREIKQEDQKQSRFM
jgi:hypothetical protein